MRIITDIAIFGLIIFGSMLDSENTLPIWGVLICLLWVGVMVMRKPRSAATLPELTENNSKEIIA